MRVTEQWKDDDCQLKPGAIVQGRVVHVAKRSKVSKVSQMQLAFTAAECGNPLAKPLALTFIALVGAYGEDRAPNGSGLAEAPPLADLPGLAIGTDATTTRDAPSGFRSVTGASAINDYSQVIRQTRKLPTQILPGQVIDAPRLEIHVAAGDEGCNGGRSDTWRRADRTREHVDSCRYGSPQAPGRCCGVASKRYVGKASLGRSRRRP